MKRFLLVSMAVAIGAGPAMSQEWAKARLDKSPRHQEWIKVKSSGRELECFIVYPEVKDAAPAVLVIHEIFGLTDWARDVADRLAEAGYIAIAPDLLSGTGPSGGGTKDFADRDEAMRAVSHLAPSQVTADLNAAAAYVTALPACNHKLAVGGFCWGGTQTFRYATHNPSLKAAFVFYGSGPTNAADIAKIQCPVYGFYGGNDNRVTATVPHSAELMKKAGKTYESVTYGGAHHGFMRMGEAPDAKPDDAKAFTAAWKRWLELLGKV
jgi:carboxymethylenebutenolidase